MYPTTCSVHKLPQFGAVFAVAFSPDSIGLATGGEDYNVRIYSIEGGAFSAKRTGHVDAVWTAAFAPDGSMLATAGTDGKVRLWGPEPEAAPRELPGAWI